MTAGLPTPVSWLTQNRDQLPASGRALDVACGRGRHALWLGEEGFTTVALDRDVEAVQLVNTEAARRRLPVHGEVMDLETPGVSFGAGVYDVIVVINYLHRPLFPALVSALTPGGVLVYETFTRAQGAKGKPTNPAFLLEPGELPRLVEPLDVVKSREGKFEERWVASVIARRPDAI